jgi:RNA:NAD 2'-phosphotransferase (TPT1/KptA family)
MSKDPVVGASKLLSLILRHRPDKFGLNGVWLTDFVPPEFLCLSEE